MQPTSSSTVTTTIQHTKEPQLVFNNFTQASTSFRYLKFDTSSPRPRSRRFAAYSAQLPLKTSTWLSPSKARMCVATLSKKKRSCETTRTVPACVDVQPVS